MRVLAALALAMFLFQPSFAETESTQTDANLGLIEVAQQGCCSWHDGVCGCSGGRVQCCDGTLSPSCQCQHESMRVSDAKSIAGTIADNRDVLLNLRLRMSQDPFSVSAFEVYTYAEEGKLTMTTAESIVGEIESAQESNPLNAPGVAPVLSKFESQTDDILRSLNEVSFSDLDGPLLLRTLVNDRAAQLREDLMTQLVEEQKNEDGTTKFISLGQTERRKIANELMNEAVKDIRNAAGRFTEAGTARQQKVRTLETGFTNEEFAEAVRLFITEKVPLPFLIRNALPAGTTDENIHRVLDVLDEEVYGEPTRAGGRRSTEQK